MSNTNKSSTQLLTTKEEIYAAHQALVDVIGGQYRKELDLLVKLARTALAAIPAESSDDKKPLTAEFFLRNNEKTHWAANGPDGTGAPYIVYGTKRIAIIKAMEEYAAQQTAALREELEAAKKEIAENDALLIRAAELSLVVIKMCDGVKKAIEVFAPYAPDSEVEEVMSILADLQKSVDALKK